MLTQVFLDKIAKHIGETERKTTGEIVIVLAKQSDDYRYIPILWAALIALLLPFIFVIRPNLISTIGLDGWLDNDISRVYFLQLVVFIVGFSLVQIPKIKFLLIPKKVKLRRAMRLAREQFMRQELHATEDRTGVLLFISLAEQYVEVIADQGIYQKLAPSIWQDIIDALIVDIKRDKMDDGLMSAVDKIGDTLQVHFPRDDKAYKNELSNHLILL